MQELHLKKLLKTARRNTRWRMLSFFD